MNLHGLEEILKKILQFPSNIVSLDAVLHVFNLLLQVCIPCTPCALSTLKTSWMFFTLYSNVLLKLMLLPPSEVTRVGIFCRRFRNCEDADIRCWRKNKYLFTQISRCTVIGESAVKYFKL